MILTAPALHAGELKAATAKPDIVIPVDPLGYGKPGELYLSLRYSQVSLDFVDPSHLLFTFQIKGLLRHSIDELPDDDDQTIHAVVVDLPDGKVSASADWRMHDRQRYLWPLGSGAFLVRQRDTLFVTGASLELRPYGKFPGRLMQVQVSPAGDMLVAQTDEPETQKDGSPPSEAGKAATTVVSSPSPEGKRIVMRFFRVKDRALIAQSRLRRPIRLPVNGSGFVDSLEGKHNQWTLSFTPLTEGATTASSKPFAALTSACTPTVTFVNSETILVMRCTPTNNHLTTILTLDGKMLWEHNWQTNGVWPTWVFSQDGARFAQGLLTSLGRFADVGPLTPGEISGQRVDVLDTTSGKLLLSAPASPVYDAGQNYALSADGRRFAILHNSAIEIYDLPAAAK